MSTFVYSPRVTAFLSVTDKSGNAKVLDVSEDLTAGDMILRESDVHEFSFNLQNAQRKYDGMIRPMDRIVIAMARIGAPLQVFAGYMDIGPIFSVWPRVLPLKATCTMKRLQFWYWDSNAPASAQLIQDWQQAAIGNTDQAGGDTASSALPKTTDGGLRDLVIRILTSVVQWPKERIHIGAIPDNWYAFATQIGDEIIKAADYTNLIGNLGGTAVASGSSLSGNGQLPSGTYAGLKLDQDQANNAATIYNVASSRKLSPRAAAQGIATAIVESGLRNLAGGDRDSVGLFQQRPSQGWGTPAQCQDPVYAAGKFFDALVKVANHDTAEFGSVCQAVQRSAFPDKYVKQQAAAEAIVAAIQGSSATAGTTTGVGQGGTIGTPQPGGSTGRMMAASAYNLIKAHEPGYIRYQMGNDDPFNAPDPRVLDCSSFMDVAYYRTVGRPLISPRSTVSTERPKCKIIPTDLAKKVKGALLFMGDHHVETSLGNGYSAGAHTDSVPLAQQVSIVQANGFSDGGLLPGVNYADSATDAASAAQLAQVVGYSCSPSDPNEFPADGAQVTTGAGGSGSGDSAADVFNSLINIYTWGYEPDVGSIALVGPRALMNDEPILPFISNLMKASMRSWCSAPNGDFMAWFPDYFDMWNVAAKMDVRAIELKDFTVMWSDQQIVTHQYVIGVPISMNSTFDSQGNTSVQGGSQDVSWALTTSGVATMDFPQIFRALFGQDASQDFLDEYLGRFGGRPNTVTVPSIHQGRPEFFMALYLFMRRWADQFSTSVPMTFMPELWPGMILRLPEFNFQAYVTEVRHSFQFGNGGFFRTEASICAPARIQQKENDVFGLLPLSGSAALKGAG